MIYTYLPGLCSKLWLNARSGIGGDPREGGFRCWLVAEGIPRAGLGSVLAKSVVRSLPLSSSRARPLQIAMLNRRLLPRLPDWAVLTVSSESSVAILSPPWEVSHFNQPSDDRYLPVLPSKTLIKPTLAPRFLWGCWLPLSTSVDTADPRRCGVL